MGWPVPDIPERKMLPEPVYTTLDDIINIYVNSRYSVYSLSLAFCNILGVIFIYGALPMLQLAKYVYLVLR